MNSDEAKKIVLAFLRVKNLAIQTRGPGSWYGSISEYWLKNLSKSNKDKWDRYWSKLKREALLREGIDWYNNVYYGGSCSGRCM